MKISSQYFVEIPPFIKICANECCNRSQVQGSTFRVKNKKGINYPESTLKILILPSNCQFDSKFWIRPDEADAFLVNTYPKCSPGMRMEP
jgi:hypothetical protein